MPFEISDFTVSPLTDSTFVKPVRLHYTQNGNKRSWEAVKCHDAVSILLYHEEKDALLLVKQFRPPVHMNHPEHTHTYELCAGIVDKEASLEQIAKDEILEECGYDVDLDKILKIGSFYTNVGVAGSKQTLYYARINESVKVSNGGGVHNEEIFLKYIPVNQAKEFMADESRAKTPGLMFAFYWFLAEIYFSRK